MNSFLDMHKSNPGQMSGRQIHRFSYRIQGYVKIADYAIHWKIMVSEKVKHITGD